MPAGNPGLLPYFSSVNVLFNGILTAGIIQGLILVVLLLRKEINRLPNRLLAALIFLISVHLILMRMEAENQFFSYPHLSKVADLFPAVYGPILLLLVSSIAEAGFRFRKRHLALLIPFLAALAWLAPHYLMDGEAKREYLAGRSPALADERVFFTEASNLLYMGFAAAALIVFYQERKRLYGYFSNPSRVRLEWLEQILLVLLGVITLSVASYYSKAYGLPNFPEVYPYHLAVVVVLVYWMGFQLVQDPTVFTAGEPDDGQAAWDEPEERGEEEADEGPGAADRYGADLEERRALAARIARYMEEYKPYLNPNLTLNDLSSELQITRRELSRAITLEFNRSFFGFVNEYRVREFRREVDLGLNKHLSLLGIALNCGFTSGKDFRRTFRLLEGMPPASYIRQRSSGAA